MKIAAYCRVSTDKTDQINSLQAQIRFFSEFTEKEGHELVGIYADEGISGTRMKNRREFLRLLSDAKDGLFEMVVVKDISRFARNTVDFLQSVRELKTMGVETVFLTANMSALGNSEFVLTIFGALAQEESANTSKRVKFGKQINAQKGRVPNLIYGYEKTAGDYFHLEINQAEADVIRRIFSRYTQEGLGCTRIANWLNQAGFRTKRGYLWSQNAVSRILQNPIYQGDVVNGKEEVADFLTGRRVRKKEQDWVVVRRPELAIVSDEVFASAQQIFQSRRSQKGSPPKCRQLSSSLYRNLIRCQLCGYPYRRVIRRYQNTYIRWICSGHNGKGNDFCGNKFAVDEGELTEEIKRYLFSLFHSQREWVEREWTRALHRGRRKHGDEQNRRRLEETAYRLRQKKARYLSLYGDELLTREELEPLLAALEDKLDEISRLQKEEGAAEQTEGGCNAEQWSEEEILQDWFEGITRARFAEIVDRIEVAESGTVEVYFRLLQKNVPTRNVGT